jgi:hypothetical protein
VGVWEVEFTDEFESWWDGLSEEEQDDVAQSRDSGMRELRVQIHGKPFRVLYAFDPRRVAILLIGGDKTGNDRWYDTQVPVADRLFDEHLIVIAKEIRAGKKGSS